MLSHEDASVRNVAVVTLGALGAREAVNPLIELLYSSVESDRERAIEALGQIGDPKAVVPLVLSLKNGKDPMYMILNALERIDSFEVLEALITDREVDIYGAGIFHLARRLAYRHQRPGSPYLPVYPELIEKYRASSGI